MNDIATTVSALVQHFETIEQQMRGLPVFNARLNVEAVGFRAHGEHDIGVLVTPWFINLVLLPGTGDWCASAPGARCIIALPAEEFEFSVCHDDVIGTFLSAVLFRSVDHFADQGTARQIADEILLRLFTETADNIAVYSRRQLFRRIGAS